MYRIKGRKEKRKGKGKEGRGVKVENGGGSREREDYQVDMGSFEMSPPLSVMIMKSKAV